jgi:hypothetical protein
MSEKIDPALTAEEWAHAMDADVRDGLAYEVCYLWGRSRPAGAIAIANAALPDSDPRKITREKLRLVGRLMGAHEDDEKAFLDALESYLPPESAQ